MTEVARKLGEICKRERLIPPARTTIYNAILRVPVRQYSWMALPLEVREALYNASAEGGEDASRRVGGDQVAFYALNCGQPRALSFAAGLRHRRSPTGGAA